ncbi:hypothetical protein [Cryptosporangium minutisporangium]|uniref:ABC transporter permease n=1 Tax=Cryptosporangium minutisporangium TaxID=113569 RepID=A0ABP6SSS3_9ACTN
MTGRILRLELRRSAAVGIGALSLLVGGGLLLSFPEGFAGRWMQLAVFARSLLLVTWPLALAGGAWLGRREARSRVGELFASTPRPRAQRILPTAAALAITVVVAYLLVFVSGIPWVVPTAAYFPAGTLLVAGVGAVAMVTAAWLGLAAGRALPWLVTAPALAVVGVAVAGLLPDWLSVDAEINGGEAPKALLLSPVYSGGADDFEVLLPRVSLIQTLWLVAVAVTGLLLFAAVRRRSLVLATLPAVLAAAVALPLLPSGGYPAAAKVDPDAVALVCDDDGPQVCVTRVHAATLPDIVGPGRQVLGLLAAKLPDAPTRAVESWRGPQEPAVRHSRDTILFYPPSITSAGRAEPDDYLRTYLAEAAWRQECTERSGPVEPDLGRAVAAAWLTGQPPASQDWWSDDDRTRANALYRTLTALPPAEQRRRMSAAREAALDCRDDALLPILSGAR